MTTRCPNRGIVAALALTMMMSLMLVGSLPVSATAEETGQAANKIRVAVMNFENNSSW